MPPGCTEIRPHMARLAFIHNQLQVIVRQQVTALLVGSGEFSDFLR